MMSASRSATAAGVLLVWRRARRDGVMLAAWTLTVALAALLAIMGPAHLTATIDAGAREAVASSGSASDLVVGATVDASDDRLQLPTLTPPEIEEEALALVGKFPLAVRETLGEPTVSVTGPPLLVTSAEVQPALAVPTTRLRMAPAMLTSQNRDALEVVDGALPTEEDAAPGSPLPVVVSVESARATSLAVGSVISLPITDSGVREPVALRAEIVGIVRDAWGGPERLSPWRDVAEAWEPSILSDGDSTLVGIAVMMSPTSADRLIGSQGSSFTGALRYPFDPATVTSERLADAVTESQRLVDGGGVVASTGVALEVSSGLADAVSDFPGSARATLAELSIIIAGVIGAAGAVLVLTSRLIVARRIPELLLERARGSSLAAIVLRNLAEATITVAIGVLVAAGVAAVIGFGRLADPAPLAIVVGIGLLVGVVQIIAGLISTANASSNGVNRRDVIARHRQLRRARLVIELAVIGLAVGSVAALLDRGLLQTSSTGIDPLIATAPLFVAAAVTVVVLRGSGVLARLAVAAAASSRGIAGPVVASRVPRGISVVPLAALTIATALVVGTAIVASTVRAGQVDASWQAVGADVRVEGGVTAPDVELVRAAEGVDAASGFATDSAQLAVGTGGTRVTLVAIDREYPGVVALLPAIDGVSDAAASDEFGSVSRAVPDGAPLPVLVDDAIADRLPSEIVTMQVGADDVEVQVVGSLPSRADAAADESRVYVDLAALADRLPSAVGIDSLVAVGEGADAAVARLDLAESVTLTRSGWLDDRRRLPLVAGVEQGMLVGAVALALLALIAVVCTALAGSRERARYLALLRTLGVRSRFGLVLAVLDQVPLMVAALVSGALAGVGTAVVISPALGLEFLTGGLPTPRLAIPPALLPQVFGGVVLVFAIGTLVEVLLRRRDRVSDTIRVGETI